MGGGNINYYENCVGCGVHKRVYGKAGARRCRICNKEYRYPKPCECGCEELTLNSFVSGHNIRELSAKEQRRRGLFCRLKDWSFRVAKSSTYLKKDGHHIHRQVAEHKLGRPLAFGEIAHHVDHNKHNNDPSNIEVLASQAEHARIHGFGLESARVSGRGNKDVAPAGSSSSISRSRFRQDKSVPGRDKDTQGA